MELGCFSMPSHPPERRLTAGHDRNLQALHWLDERRYTEHGSANTTPSHGNPARPPTC